MSATPTILVLNAGSSSVKFRLFEWGEDLPLLARGGVSGLGTAPAFSAQEEETATGHPAAFVESPLPAASTHENAMATILEWVESHAREWRIAAAGHRVVHGGPLFHDPVLLDAAIVEKLRALTPLAPLHQPHNLAAMEILSALKPGLIQAACFDTAFHAKHTPLFTTYALPPEMQDKGIRRYGFHGLSYEWIARVLKQEHPDLGAGRVIAAHLGNGSSLCAIRNGQSVDSSMGMTVLDGLPMGTRCGSIDPGAVLFMIRNLGMTTEEAERLLYKNAGLKGLSGISNDVKTLLESQDARAHFALAYFTLKIAQNMAAMAVSMGGADAVVFTGGIGENAAPLRQAVMERLSGLLTPRMLVIPANEERMIAEHVASLIPRP